MTLAVNKIEHATELLRIVKTFTEVSASRRQRNGTSTARTSKPSMPEKSSGFVVYSGNELDTAMAAIIASKERAAVFRPERRIEAATCPNARAAAASNGSGSKSDSACCRCACRAARSAAVEATNGPTDNSARVIVVINASSGSADGSTKRGSRMTMFVSRMPRSCLTLSITASGGSKCHVDD